MAEKKSAPELVEESEPSLSLEEALELLAGPVRRKRQEASHALSLLSRDDTSLLAAHTEDLIDALERPEAQTRWEILDVLSRMGLEDVADVSDAADAAEASLFDESSSTVRLAAFRLLAVLGSKAPEASDEYWPLLDEAVQCYHGDVEYRDMLTALLTFAQGDISDASRLSLIERINFDAENGRGFIKSCSVELIRNSIVRENSRVYIKAGLMRVILPSR